MVDGLLGLTLTPFNPEQRKRGCRLRPATELDPNPLTPGPPPSQARLLWALGFCPLLLPLSSPVPRFSHLLPVAGEGPGGVAKTCRRIPPQYTRAFRKLRPPLRVRAVELVWKISILFRREEFRITNLDLWIGGGIFSVLWGARLRQNHAAHTDFLKLGWRITGQGTVLSRRRHSRNKW